MMSKRIEGYPMYLIYEDGKVWSDWWRRFLKPSADLDDRAQVCLYDGKGSKKTIKIQRLVAIHFVDKPISNEVLIVCHNDGNKYNNHYSNLRWDTYRENSYDVVRHGKHHNASKTHCKYGHLLELPNLVKANWEKRGDRLCLACDRARGVKRNHPEIEFSDLQSFYYEAIMNDTKETYPGINRNGKMDKKRDW